jgi:acetylornithine/succinyldiaminopimelate/putrescine aminotransferase
MLGIRLACKAVTVQQQLLEKGFVTGTSSCPNTLRILPPLNVEQQEMAQFVSVLAATLEQVFTAQPSLL